MAAAEAAAAPSGCTGGNSSSTAAASTTTSRFAAACGALSQYVKAAEAERTRAQGRPMVVVRPLPLMPGADVDDDQEEEPAQTAQLTIVYGGRALVLDDVTPDKAADLLRLATAAAARGGTGGTEQPPHSSVVADLPVARKASLQRFMEKRKGRIAARAEPYRRPGDRRDHLTLAL